MQKQYKAALLAAIGLAAVSTSQAAAYPAGDLLIGFTVGSGSDVVYDLGQESSLSNGETWNLGSLLSGYTLGNVNWGVIGNTSIGGTPKIAYTTTGGIDANAVPNNSTFTKLNSSAAAIYQNFATAGAGQSASILVSDDNSWNSQTINGALTSAYHNAYENPNVTGLTSDSLWSVQVGGAPALVGNFTLDNSGTVTFTAVPEPTTIGLLAGGGLLFAAFRNRSNRKTA